MMTRLDDLPEPFLGSSCGCAASPVSCPPDVFLVGQLASLRRDSVASDFSVEIRVFFIFVEGIHYDIGVALVKAVSAVLVGSVDSAHAVRVHVWLVDLPTESLVCSHSQSEVSDLDYQKLNQGHYERQSKQ